jgi:chemotaxis family two-component system response regulator Rcp1
MHNEPTITLHYVQKDGEREETKLTHHTMDEARKVAKAVLHVGNGRYKEVDICTEDGTVETIQNPAAPIHPHEVLLVEDNAGDALLVGQALVDCPAQVHLHIARDGEQALQILGEPDYRPELIILDLNIPKISGYTVLAMYPQKKKPPVVVFTASENEADVSRALSLGAKDFVHKPMDLDDYKTTVCGMVQKWTGRCNDTSSSRVQ